MFEAIMQVGLIIFSISLALCVWRALKGPTLWDRVVALDSFGLNLIGFIGIIMILQSTNAFAEVVLVLGILAFVSSVALAKFLERGVVIDRDSH
ncbi:Na(+)/H(+) antiporter subunit F1 [Natribacillus halophilus]|uniref:Multisubunit sodium/proton antiporter, MrpF subunit n=1 Tax=Natribacillus halophilus TaxID=549003 RepID=A0A1G8JV32_9BACI|nr:Na(+)/H(+) antiporter subunit F1 [Natribacillus halophilus]SDI35086.1 multisubunit sodium/proton antiporter, MrpF subunit [Natribacillus halophilus]